MKTYNHERAHINIRKLLHTRIHIQDDIHARKRIHGPKAYLHICTYISIHCPMQLRECINTITQICAYTCTCTSTSHLHIYPYPFTYVYIYIGIFMYISIETISEPSFGRIVSRLGPSCVGGPVFVRKAGTPEAWAVCSALLRSS